MGLFANVNSIMELNRDYMPEVQQLFNNFHRLYREEEGVYKRDAMAVETKFIVSANRMRRNAFRAVKLIITAASLDDEPTIKEAAVLLQEVLHNYRSVTSVPMNEVTPLVHNMIEDLHKPRYITSVTAIGIGDAVDKLELKNLAFNDVYAKRARSQEISVIQGRMGEIRPKVNRAFLALAEGINSYCVTNKLAGKADSANPYRDAIVFIEGFIDQYRRILDRRRSRTTGSDEPDDGSVHNDGVDEHVTSEAPATPALAISVQDVESATRMLLVAEDQEAFAKALYPSATDGVMKLSAADFQGYDEFPIVAFDVQGGRATGFTVSPPRSGLAFRRPMHAVAQASAKIVKDGATLATLTGVVWPEIYWP
jgi:hypothetical protein